MLCQVTKSSVGNLIEQIGLIESLPINNNSHMEFKPTIPQTERNPFTNTKIHIISWVFFFFFPSPSSIAFVIYISLCKVVTFIYKEQKIQTLKENTEEKRALKFEEYK